jgi:hypothetical protein
MVVMLARTEKEFLRESDQDVYGPDGKNAGPDDPGSGFKEYKDAVAFAREIMYEECNFADHKDHYAEDDEPPFDSADFENYDNDSEVLISVMTKTEFAMLMYNNLQTMGLIDSRGEPIQQPERPTRPTR